MRHDKIVVHSRELYVTHRSLDNEIKKLYNEFARDETINRAKTQKP